MQTGARIIGARPSWRDRGDAFDPQAEAVAPGVFPLALFLAWTRGVDAGGAWPASGTSPLCITDGPLSIVPLVDPAVCGYHIDDVLLSRVFIFGTSLAMVNLFRSFSRGGDR